MDNMFRGNCCDTGNTIGREQFVSRHVLYCFDLTPDLSSSCGHYLSVAKSRMYDWNLDLK